MSEAQTVAIVRIGEQNGDCGAGEKTRHRPKNRDCPQRSEVRAKTGLSLLLGFSTETTLPTLQTLPSASMHFSFPRSPVGMHIGNRLRPRRQQVWPESSHLVSRQSEPDRKSFSPLSGGVPEGRGGWNLQLSGRTPRHIRIDKSFYELITHTTRNLRCPKRKQSPSSG